MLEHNEDQILIGLIDLYIYMIIMCVYIYMYYVQYLLSDLEFALQGSLFFKNHI